MDDTGRRGAVLDYGLIDSNHTHLVTSFVIDEQARYSCGSDHALLVASLTFNNLPKVTWKQHETVHYDFHSESSFTQFQEHLKTNVSKVPLSEFEGMTVEEMLPHLTSSLNDSGKAAFGIKSRKKRTKGRKLPPTIIE